MKEFVLLKDELIKQIREDSGLEDDSSHRNVKSLRRYKYYLISALSNSRRQVVCCDFICNLIFDVNIPDNPCYDDYGKGLKKLLIEHDNYIDGLDRRASSKIYNSVRFEKYNYLEDCQLLLEEIKEVDKQIASIRDPGCIENKSIVEEVTGSVKSSG